MSKRVILVQISGQEYRIRTDADEALLQRMAGVVDESMSRVTARTGTVDTLQVAILSSLSIARDLIALQSRPSGASGTAGTDDDRLRDLIILAESALMDERAGGAQTPLLTVPAGHEVDGTEGELLGSLVDDAADAKAAPPS